MGRPQVQARQTNGGEVEDKDRKSPYPYTIEGLAARPPLPGSAQAITPERPSGTVSSRCGPALPASLMTPEELALLLHMSKGAVYAKVARGGIPGAVRLGRTLRFDPRIIAQWLSAKSASAGGQP